MQLHKTPAADGAYARFAHDCKSCCFLGQFGEHDLYFCQGSFEPTVIARRSEEGGDYHSGMAFSFGANPSLTEARRRAQAQGLYSFDLRSALYHTLQDADVDMLNELRVQLRDSDLGNVLASFDKEGPMKATELLAEYVETTAEQLKKKSATLTLADARRFAGSTAMQACEWAFLLELPAPPSTQLFWALGSLEGSLKKCA